VRRALALAAFSLAFAACSPEAGRVRSGGPGADTGNRGALVQLHPGGSEAYFGTPNLNPRNVIAAKK
jgi:hypothetical protein